jgi:hypothetical protein
MALTTFNSTSRIFGNKGKLPVYSLKNNLGTQLGITTTVKSGGTSILITDYSTVSYHTLTLNYDRTCELIMGGAGGGGGNQTSKNCGGGGSGGIYYATNILIPAGTYTIYIGRGGISATTGAQGGNTSFAGIICTGGGGGTCAYPGYCTGGARGTAYTGALGGYVDSNRFNAIDGETYKFFTTINFTNPFFIGGGGSWYCYGYGSGGNKAQGYSGGGSTSTNGSTGVVALFIPN